ncbi:MAG: TetR/AcrR family transcriptional regulator [Spirochaetes bacterium]|nr:TetR/AcrR family transcriptional regulator [Spirochaetota bacterium]
MAKKKDTTRQRILDVAEILFSDKGYDGASIDEISLTAGVNKRMIYYYFGSKKGLLDTLFQNFLRESSSMLMSFVRHGGLESSPDEEAEESIGSYFAYYEEKKDILKIMLMESLKEKEGETPLFSLVDFSSVLDASEIDYYNAQSGMSEREKNQMLVTEFFTGVMPLLAYVIFKEKWCGHFHVTKQDLERFYDRAMEMTHMAYHRMQRKKE